MNRGPFALRFLNLVRSGSVLVFSVFNSDPFTSPDVIYREDSSAADFV